MKLNSYIIALSCTVLFAPFCLAQNISISQISDNAGIHTDGRPITVGLYDGMAKHTFINRDHQ